MGRCSGSAAFLSFDFGSEGVVGRDSTVAGGSRGKLRVGSSISAFIAYSERV